MALDGKERAVTNDATWRKAMVIDERIVAAEKGIELLKKVLLQERCSPHSYSDFQVCSVL